MTNDNIEDWIEAKKVFEKYIDQPLQKSLKQLNDDKHVSSKVKSIVVRLIQSQTNEETLFDQPDLSLFESGPKEIEDLSGKYFAGFQLIKRIGQGGMSNVYKAKRIDTDIQKFVALKLLTPIEGGLSDTLKLLFEREQVTLSKLNHPNIISFHHGGISQNGIPFLVMDFIEDAVNINEYVSDKNLSKKEVVALIKNIADAINYAHQNLVIHKDIKPNNILIDKLGMPKVVDFGIASFEKVKTETQSNLTALMFTPDYASPEQVRSANITANSDVFSLAALLLGLLTHKKPLPEFNGTDINEDDYKHHIERLIKQSDINVDLKHILSKALQIDVEKRYQSMLEFLNDLDAFLNLKPVSARKLTLVYQFKKYLNRNPALSLAIFAFTISTVFGFLAIIKQKNKAQLEASKAQQVTDFLIQSIQANDPDINQGNDMSVKELLLNAKITIQETSFQDQYLSSTLEQTIGSALATVGQYKEAEHLLLKAIVSDENNFDAHISLAQLYLTQQYFEKTQSSLDLLTNKKSSLTHNQTIQYQQLKANLLFHKGKFESGISVIDTIMDDPNITTKQLIDSKLILSKFINEQGESQKSIDILYEALALSNAAFSETSTSSTNILFSIANVYSDMNPLPEKKLHEVYLQTINNQVIIYGDNHPYLAKTYLQYGFALKVFGEYGESRNFANKAKNIALSNFGENHMLNARVNILTSQLNLLENNIEDAIAQLEAVVSIYETQYGIDHSETNQVKTTLAGYYLTAKQGQKALRMLEPMYESLKQQVGEKNKATIYAKMNILKAYNLNGDYKLAIDEGIKLLVISKENLGPEAILTVGVQLELANNYFNNHNYNQSILLSEELLTFSLVKNNDRYKKIVSDLRNKTLLKIN